jgi:hypothetical protein
MYKYCFVCLFIYDVQLKVTALQRRTISAPLVSVASMKWKKKRRTPLLRLAKVLLFSQAVQSRR